MAGKHKLAFRGRTTASLAGMLVAIVVVSSCSKRQPITIKGAVIQQNTDPRKELPVTNAEVSALVGLSVAVARSGSSGYFILTLSPRVKRGEPITFRFRHPDYRPLDLQETVGDKVYIAHMVPVLRKNENESNPPDVVVTNVKIRYSVKSTAAVNIGSAVRTFEVPNTGNIPCNGGQPCSPDGKWKASIVAASLDAGEGNEFRNARVSCIAGPCPFTKIDSDGFSRGGRRIDVSVRNWSETTTFLVEAEVFHPMVSDLIRESYPVIFGQALNFSLPATAEGAVVEADVNGESIIFPLGPSFCLSWADCTVLAHEDLTRVYRCELKPGYQFH